MFFASGVQVKMDSNNWSADQGQVKIPGQVVGGEAMANPGMEGGDWRTQLQLEPRQRVVKKILETLKRHIPFNGEDGFQELKNIAVRCEEMIYTEATSQRDYLRQISLKMLKVESNSASNSRNPHDLAFLFESQIQNKVQQVPIVVNQSQVQQQLLSQNYISSSGVPNSVVGISQGTTPDVPGNNPNMQNMSNVTMNAIGNPLGQGVPSNMYANATPQQVQWNMANMLHNQGQLPQLQPFQQQHPLLLQQHPLLLQQQQLMQQQLLQQHPVFKFGSHQQANTFVKDMQERLKPSGPLLRQQKQATLNSSVGNAIGGDSLQEKLINLKDKFEQIMQIISTLKKEVQPHHKEKIVGLEKLFVEFLNFNRHRRPVSSLQQGQLVPPPVQAMPQSQISQTNATEGQMKFQMQPLVGSRAAVGEVPSGTKRMREFSSAMPSNVVSSTDSMNDKFRHLTVNEPDGASSVRSPRLETKESRVETTGLADALAQNTKLHPCLTKLNNTEEMLAALMREKGPESTSPQPAPAAVLPIPSSESVVIGPKLDFPIFDAEDPMAWISRVYSYFRVHKTDESARIELALAAMDGPALQWMQSILRRQPAITWKKFGFELLRWYGYSNPAIVNPLSLATMTQTGSVDEYVDMFVSRTAHVQRLPDSHSLALFLNGLRDDIRVRISSRDVTNTFDAIHLALEIERELLSVGTACLGKGIIELSHADYVELLSKGLCFKCREPCQPLHNCSGKKLRVVIAAEEDGGDETMACGEVPGPEAT